MLVGSYKNVNWLPSESILEVYVNDQELPSDLCTSAFAVVVDGDSFVLANVIKRGLDIPGGHIEQGETPKDAVIREILEETGAVVEIITKLGHNKLYVPNPPLDYKYPTPVSYQPFYLARVIQRGQPTAIGEVTDPVYFKLCETAGLRDTHKPFFHKAHEIITRNRT